MPRYYFNIRCDREVIPDKEGMELPNLDAVRDEAEVAAREVICERIMHGTPIDDREFHVVDEHQATVLQVPLKSVIQYITGIAFVKIAGDIIHRLAATFWPDCYKPLRPSVRTLYSTFPYILLTRTKHSLLSV